MTSRRYISKLSTRTSSDASGTPKNGASIEAVYNRNRLHTALGMMSPVEFENSVLAECQDEAETLTQAA